MGPLEHPHWGSICDPTKIFLTSKFSCLLFSNPTHKTEMGTANRWELLIANHLDQSLWLANQKRGKPVISYLLYSSRQVHVFAALFNSLNKLSKYAGEKPFSWAKPTYDDFSSSNFLICRVRYWALVGMDALIVVLAQMKSIGTELLNYADTLTGTLQCRYAQ